MMGFARSLLIAGTVATGAALFSGTADAAAVGPTVAAGGVDRQLAKQGMVEPVQGRRFRRGVAVGVGAAIVGGFLLSEAARAEHRRDKRVAWERCADRFRSFDWESGTYVNEYGERRVCPYLD